jgi:FkbM family methyltransferase
MNVYVFLQRLSVIPRNFLVYILNKLGLKVEFHDLLPIRLLNRVSTLFMSKSSLDRRFMSYYSGRSSYAQIFQDLFVIFILESASEKTDVGYFVDIGATDGIGINNTYLLETKYKWNGIVVEPARHWRQDLARNRKAIVETRCVWDTSNTTIQFMETQNAGQSGLACTNQDDAFVNERKSYVSYDVQTISLEDLLVSHNSPAVIDFLSIDTEGAEYSILRNFDFNHYCFKVIAVEHNYNKQHCADLDSLLTANGYIKVCRLVSWVDYWYVHSSVYSKLEGTPRANGGLSSRATTF